MSGQSSGDTHPLTLPIVIGAAGLLLGIGGSVIFVGGSFRQVEINTGRLDRIEMGGSPALLALGVKVDELRRDHDQTAADLAASVRRDVDMKEALGRLEVQAAELIQVRDRAVTELNSGLQRLAILETKATGVSDLGQRVAAIEAHINQLSGSSEQMRSILSKHIEADSLATREELSSLKEEARARQSRTPTNQPTAKGQP